MGLWLTPAQHRQVLGNPEVAGSSPAPATLNEPWRRGATVFR